MSKLTPEQRARIFQAVANLPASSNFSSNYEIYELPGKLLVDEVTKLAPRTRLGTTTAAAVAIMGAMNDQELTEMNYYAIQEHTRARDRRKAQRSRGGQVDHYLFEHASNFYRRHPDKKLCPECRRINAHGAGCSQPEWISIPYNVQVPRCHASLQAWKKFAKVFVGIYGQHNEVITKMILTMQVERFRKVRRK